MATNQAEIAAAAAVSRAAEHRARVSELKAKIEAEKKKTAEVLAASLGLGFDHDNAEQAMDPSAEVATQQAHGIAESEIRASQARLLEKVKSQENRSQVVEAKDQKEMGEAQESGLSILIEKLKPYYPDLVAEISQYKRTQELPDNLQSPVNECMGNVILKEQEIDVALSDANTIEDQQIYLKSIEVRKDIVLGKLSIQEALKEATGDFFKQAKEVLSLHNNAWSDSIGFVIRSGIPLQLIKDCISKYSCSAIILAIKKLYNSQSNQEASLKLIQEIGPKLNGVMLSLLESDEIPVDVIVQPWFFQSSFIQTAEPTTTTTQGLKEIFQKKRSLETCIAGLKVVLSKWRYGGPLLHAIESKKIPAEIFSQPWFYESKLIQSWDNKVDDEGFCIGVFINFFEKFPSPEAGMKALSEILPQLKLASKGGFSQLRLLAGEGVPLEIAKEAWFYQSEMIDCIGGEVHTLIGLFKKYGSQEADLRLLNEGLPKMKRHQLGGLVHLDMSWEEVSDPRFTPSHATVMGSFQYKWSEVAHLHYSQLTALNLFGAVGKEKTPGSSNFMLPMVVLFKPFGHQKELTPKDVDFNWWTPKHTQALCFLHYDEIFGLDVKQLEERMSTPAYLLAQPKPSESSVVQPVLLSSAARGIESVSFEGAAAAVVVDDKKSDANKSKS